MFSKKLVLTFIASLIAFVCILPAYDASTAAKKGFEKNDIRYIWQDGNDIANGINPYSRIHGSDMRFNQKYSTYLPGFFLVVAATYSAGLTEYADFMSIWRPINLACLVLLGAIVFYYAYGSGGLMWGVFAGTFVWLNRWTLQIVNSGQLDVLGALLLLIGVLMLEKERHKGWLLIGASLAIKQMALFTLPLLLAYEIKTQGWKQALSSVLLLALIPGLCCLPFLLDDPVGLIKSVLFSATRLPGGTFRVESYDQYLDLVGVPAKLLMISLIAALSWTCLTGHLTRFAQVTLALGVFICFNSVLLKQYMAWLIPFVPFALIHPLRSKPNVDHIVK